MLLEINQTSEYPLEELSWKITKHASVVSQYLASQNLPQPSKNSDGPSTTVPTDAPEYVRRSLQNLVGASLEMSQLALGPSEFVPNLATGVRLALAFSREILIARSFNMSLVSPGSASSKSSDWFH